MIALDRTVSCTLAILLTSGVALAQERPYFVTYDDQLEERGELELELLSTSGKVKDEGAGYVAPWLELEYGVTKWWTAELYLESAAFRGGSAFTGWRVESRFRPISGDHVINPVLYVEYEDINEASRIQKEIVGRGPLPFEPISTLKEERARELEGRLILSSWFRRWNVSENLVVEKNFSADEGVEFGYAAGVARSFREPGTWECRFCAGAFTVGLEAYGGVGTTAADASGATRQFIAPVISWQITSSSVFKASVAFGMTTTSDRLMYRVGYTVNIF